jgi:hypothetical protein
MTDRSSDVRGLHGQSRAIRDAFRDALAAGVTDTEQLADILAAALAAGDPHRRQGTLFGPHPDHQPADPSLVITP